MFICIYSGSLVLTAIQVSHGGPRRNLILLLLSIAFLLLVAGLVQVQRRWRLETILRDMIIAMALVYAGMLVGLWAQHLAGPLSGLSAVVKTIVGTLALHGMGVILIWRFLRDNNTSWSEAFGFRFNPLHAVLFGVIAACVFLPVGWWLQESSIRLLDHLQKHPVKVHEQEPVQALRIVSSLFHRFVLIAVTVVLAPIAEEGFFRGILYPWIKDLGYPRVALFVTCFVFAAMHENIPAFIPLFLLSIVLILLYERTGNLLACIVTHTLFNLANLVALYLLQKQLS